MSFYPLYYPTNNWDRNNYCRTAHVRFCPQQQTFIFPNRKMQKPEYNHFRQGYGGYSSHHHQFNNHYHQSRHRQQSHHHPGGTRNVFPVLVFPQPSVNIQHGLWRLNKEIESVCDILRPSKEECQLREKLIDRIRECVKKKWSTAKVEVFGSFKTDLYLPTSDIDLVVLDNNLQRAPFYELKDELVALDICDKEKVVVLDNASVPIIKLTDKLNNIKIDIGFNIANAQESATLTQTFMSEFPSLQYLVIVLKQFLVERELNEVYTGGISSYSLILMVIGFLKGLKGTSRIEMSSYGPLLLNFLHYYTKEFNYKLWAVSIKSNTGYVPRTDNHNMLSIQDPLCDGNDVARGSYRFVYVLKAFSDALYRLNSRLEENAPYNIPLSEPVILLEMIKIPAVHRHCPVGHFVDGSGDMSISAGSSRSLAGSGESDSDSDIPSNAVPSESSSDRSDQGLNTSDTTLSSISAPLPTNSSLLCSRETTSLSHETTYHSESLDENVRTSTDDDDAAVNERLSTLKIEDDAEAVPPDVVVCDDNNNNIEKGRDEFEEKRLKQSRPTAGRSKSKCPEIAGTSSRAVVSADGNIAR